MIKNLIGGIAVGIANVIPGVSGGTMMVILGIFNRMMEAISGVFQKDNDHRKEDILFLLQVLIGAAVGLIGFAKILEFLFNHYPTQTMYWLIGLIV
ncbi:MAG: undecaprenyl phosphate translocase family protein [Longibaculum sp.]